MRPDISVVHDALQYDAETGRVTWKVDRIKVRAGELAGWDNGNGYRRVEISGRRAYAHHIAWLFIYGEWPAQEIDHIDGDPENNTKANLRAADRFQNTKNSRVRSHSQSGLKGVSFDKRRRTWSARITSDKKIVFLGRHKTAESAHQAYCAAAIRLHGEFARFA